MSNFYVSGSTPSAPVTHVKLFISYALGHVTTATVKDVFDTVFDNEVTQIEELAKEDRVTGKPFKLFWITLAPARHSRVWRFVDEIEKFDKASIIYETRKGKDYYWQVRLNKDKVTPVKTTPRILPREEVTTSETATDKERAEVIAFAKTPEFSKLVDSVVFEGVIEPKLEPGEIKETTKEKRKIVISSEMRKGKAATQEIIDVKRQRLEEAEAALAEWEAR
jgi:Cu2+-containing amine oxidase